MKSQKDKTSIKKIGDDYELDLSLECFSIGFVLKTHTRIHSKKCLRVYKNLFNYDELSKDIRNNFKNIQQFFQYFDKANHYNVDVHRGIIKIKVKKLEYNEVI